MIALAILIGIPALPIYSLEYKLSKCPVDTPLGSQFIWDGPDQWKVIIGKKKFLENPLNNESLAEEMGLLKLNVIESLHLFFVP